MRVAYLTPVIVHVEDGVWETGADGVEPVDRASPGGVLVQIPFVSQLKRYELAHIGKLGPLGRDVGLGADPARPRKTGGGAHEGGIRVPQPIDRRVVGVLISREMEHVVPRDHALNLQPAVNENLVPLAELSMARRRIPYNRRRGEQRQRQPKIPPRFLLLHD